MKKTFLSTVALLAITISLISKVDATGSDNEGETDTDEKRSLGGRRRTPLAPTPAGSFATIQGVPTPENVERATLVVPRCLLSEVAEATRQHREEHATRILEADVRRQQTQQEHQDSDPTQVYHRALEERERIRIEHEKLQQTRDFAQALFRELEGRQIPDNVVDTDGSASSSVNSSAASTPRASGEQG